jgi:hypothetical protein
MSEKKYALTRIIALFLGGFWLLDGILQLQPAMFTAAFVNNVLAPNLEGEPRVITAIVAFGIRVWRMNPLWSNTAAALIQLTIAALIMIPLLFSIDGALTRAYRVGLWLSVAWALIIWIFGEGFGILATGSATFYAGAPGAALLYLILALFLLHGEKDPLRMGKLPAVAGIIFIMGAALNLTPMFWEPTMLSMLSGIPAISGWLGTFGAQGTMIGNLLAVDALAAFGLLLIFLPNRPVAWATLAFLAAVWWLGQNFGGIQTFPFGTTTDPNAAPLLMLFLIPAFRSAAAAKTP